MTTVKLYVHKYLGCFCEVRPMYFYAEARPDSRFSKTLDSLQENFDETPECWELLDSWEE